MKKDIKKDNEVKPSMEMEFVSRKLNAVTTEKPTAFWDSQGSFRLNNAATATTDVKRYKYAKLAIDRYTDKILYVVLTDEKEDAVKIRILGDDTNGRYITAISLRRKVTSYDCKGRYYKVEQKELEEESVLILTLIER